VQPAHASVPDLVEALAAYAVELREKLAAMPAKQRRGSKVQGPTALRFR
jgi:uroporphyrinogen III methyltransferase/synthase